MLEFLKNIKGISIDIETKPQAGLKKDAALHFKRNEIVCVGFAWEENGIIKSIAYPFEQIKDELNLKGLKLVGHNIKFDAKTLNEKGILIDKEQIYFDTYIASCLIDENMEHGLDALSKKYLGEGKLGTFEDETKILEYCAKDAELTYKLAEKFNEELKDQKLEKLFDVEMQVVREMYVAESYGTGIDKEYLTKLLAEYLQFVDGITKHIYSYCGEEFNINSTQQLALILYNKFGLPVIKKTAGDKPSTDTRTLKTLARMQGLTCKLPKKILFYRHWEMLVRHIEKILLEEIDGKIYCSFNTVGTETGRFSCAEPNLQQIPSKKRESKAIRAGFVGSNKGLIICDYSNVELRLLAHFSRDPKLLSIYSPGGSCDLHAETAQRLGITRQEAKTINFGISYGMGPQKLAESLGIKEDKAREMLEEWFKLYYKVNEWKRMIVNSVKKYGHVRSICGRKRRIDYHSLSYKDTFKAEREAINFVIQGSSADITKLAICKLAGERILLQVHDELVIEQGVTPVCEILRKMDSIGVDLGCRVPIVAEGKAVRTWAEK